MEVPYNWVHLITILHTVSQYTKFTNPTMHLSHIPQYTTLEQKCAHFRFEVVHCGIRDKCIVRYVRLFNYNCRIKNIKQSHKVHSLPQPNGWAIESFVTRMSKSITFYKWGQWDCIWQEISEILPGKYDNIMLHPEGSLGRVVGNLPTREHKLIC